MIYLFPSSLLTRESDIVQNLKALGFSEIDVWRGNTFDHEQSPEEQLIDIVKLDNIMKAASKIGSSLEQIKLSLIGSEISSSYVQHCKAILSDSQLSEEDKKFLIIGEGNHRIVSTK